MPNKNDAPFFKEIWEDGYHIYSFENTKIKDYYLNEFPDYPGVDINELEEDDTVTIRAFFGIGKGREMRVDGLIVI